MPSVKPIFSSPKDLRYLKGWGYLNQMGAFDNHAPHVLPSKETWPAGVSYVMEQELTRGGFQPSKDHRASYLYRAHPGTSWIQDGIKPIPPIAPHWVTGSIEAIQHPQRLEPLKIEPEPDSRDLHPLSSLQTLFYNKNVSVGIASGSLPMPYFFRNADGDDLFFVHQGEGLLETELGVLGYETGHLLWIPKGLAYRFHPLSHPHQLFHMENYGVGFSKPDGAGMGDAAAYYHRNIEVPELTYHLEQGEFKIITKAHGFFTEFTHSHHPMDVLGWDGTLFPFRLHIRDINPITSWRAHVPPSVYCLFCGEGFEYCAFVPRPVESGKNALPVPFDHLNQDRDEVIFYSQGVFFSKDRSEAGSLTFHPRGFSHGPHHGALEKSLRRREKEGAFEFEGYALMVETFLPLVPTKQALKKTVSDYINSWHHSP